MFWMMSLVRLMEPGAFITGQPLITFSIFFLPVIGLFVLKKSFLGSVLVMYISSEIDLFYLDFQVYLHNFMQSIFFWLFWFPFNPFKHWFCVYDFLTHPLKKWDKLSFYSFCWYFSSNLLCLFHLYFLFQNH